ncbi:MAG: hypothetical protein ABEJ48_05190 [Halobacteriales archaeon]
MAVDTDTGSIDGGDPDASLLRRVVPAGLGVVTWLLILLVAGVVLSLDSVSVLSILLVVVLGVLFIPIYRLRPWEPGVTARFLGFVRRRRHVILVAGWLFVLVRLPVISEALSSVFALLLFPMQAVPQFLYSTTVFYDTRLGAPIGQLLFDFGRLYVELLWLYTLSGFLTKLLPNWGS